MRIARTLCGTCRGVLSMHRQGLVCNSRVLGFCPCAIEARILRSPRSCCLAALVLTCASISAQDVSSAIVSVGSVAPRLPRCSTHRRRIGDTRRGRLEIIRHTHTHRVWGVLPRLGRSIVVRGALALRVLSCALLSCRVTRPRHSAAVCGPTTADRARALPGRRQWGRRRKKRRAQSGAPASL